jgi:hypothetical protein
MKPLPDRKSVWIIGSVCVALLILLTWGGLFRGFKRVPWHDLFDGTGGTRMWLSMAPLYISHFVALLYFIPAIKTLKGVIAYSLAIPFFCVLMTHTTLATTYDLVNGVPSYLKKKSLVNIIYSLIVNEWVFSPYIASFAWLISPFLMLACSLHLYVSRRTQQCSGEQKTISISPFQCAVMETRLFRHKKLTFNTILIYFLFMLIYYKLYQSFWFEDTPIYRTYAFFTYVCLLSFLSLFLLAPVVIGQTRRIFAFCAITPLFWSVAIFALLLAMALLFSEDRFIILNKLFSIHFLTHFFLDRYLETQAWLISLPLLLVCYVYAKLAKSELT